MRFPWLGVKIPSALTDVGMVQFTTTMAYDNRRLQFWRKTLSQCQAGVALETKLKEACLDNQKIRQIPVISWPRQVRPTCLDADKNLSAETNLQGAVVLPRSTTFCEQQTKIVFLVINLSVNSVKLFSLHISLFLATFVMQCCFMVT